MRKLMHQPLATDFSRGTSWAQSPGFGVWHLVDVLSVICPGGPGSGAT